MKDQCTNTECTYNVEGKGCCNSHNPDKPSKCSQKDTAACQSCPASACNSNGKESKCSL